MTWFRCFIRGENFPGMLIGEAGLVGFYVTRFVEANDPEGAEAAALERLRAEPKLTLPPGFESAVLPQVFFEDITELAAEQVAAVQPGFAWYPMEETDDEGGAAADPAGEPVIPS